MFPIWILNSLIILIVLIGTVVLVAALIVLLIKVSVSLIVRFKLLKTFTYFLAYQSSKDKEHTDFGKFLVGLEAYKLSEESERIYKDKD